MEDTRSSLMEQISKKMREKQALSVELSSADKEIAELEQAISGNKSRNDENSKVTQEETEK